MLQRIHELFGHPYHYVVEPIRDEHPMCLRCGGWLKPKYRYGYKEARMGYQGYKRGR